MFDGAGQVGVMPGYAIDQPYIAKPMEKTATLDEQGNRTTHRTPVADLQLFPGTRLDAVNGTPIESWRDFRAALREHTQSALQDGTDASIDLTVTHPTPGSESELVSFELSHDDIASLHELGFGGNLEQFIFEETWKMTQLTYLTIDRLFRRTVGVEQLRGPIGIVHVGVTIADRGLLYLVFLLAAISVNLAVINFLPLPIVDGGLFLFLIYEKFKGKPPSIAFQNWATILGLVLIGTLFLVVTYNDIARLLS